MPRCWRWRASFFVQSFPVDQLLSSPDIFSLQLGCCSLCANFHRRGLQLKTRQFLLHQSSWSNMFQLSHRLHQGLFLPSSCLLSTHLQNSALHFVCMLPGSYCVMFLTSQCCPVSTGHQCLSAQGWVFPCWKTSWTTAHHVLWLLGGKTTLCTDSDFRNVLEIIHIFPICRCCGNYIPAGSAAQWVRD